MTRIQHQKTAGERLSQERIKNLVPDTDPDYQRLLSLAQGMVVLTSADFKPSGKPQKMRQLYKRVKNAVNKVLLECWREGLVFLVSKETAEKMAAKWGPLHYNAVSWALKKGKKEGRYICDSSDASAGSCLNSDEARRLLEEMYGEIEHPTLEGLMKMIHEYAEEMKAELGSAFS